MAKRDESDGRSGLHPEMTSSERDDALKAIPGPGRCPIVGSALKMPVWSVHKWIVEQQMIHGPVLRLKLFDIENIMLCSIEAANEAFIEKGTDCMAAPQAPSLKHLMGDDITLTSMSAPNFHVKRTTLQEGIHDSLKLEETPRNQRKIAEEVMEKYYQIGEFTVYDLSREWCTRFVCSLMFGGKYGINAYNQTARAYNELEEIMMSVFKDPKSGQPKIHIIDLIPSLFDYKWIAPKVHRRLDADKARADRHGQRILQNVRANFDGDNTKCVFDHYLKKQYQEINAEKDPVLDDDTIISIMKDLTLATYPAITNTLSTAVYLLAEKKEVTMRLQSEIDGLFSRDHVIVDADRAKMPQVEAFIMESMRYCPALPYLLPHAAERDTEVCGYKIPKGPTMRVSYYNITRNPDVYPEPDTFNIDRFLCNGKLVDADSPARASFIPFGTGGRSCPGQSFITHYFFELICYILQHFTIDSVGDIPITDPRDLQCALAPMGVSKTTKVKLIKRGL